MNQGSESSQTETLENRVERLEYSVLSTQSILKNLLLSSTKQQLTLERIEDRLEKHDHRMDQMDQRMDKMEQRMDKMEQRMDKMDKKIDVNQQENRERFDQLELLIRQHFPKN
ncbi:hypothetical protein [Endozoicomonas euniceicola]|uniref:t-SNARE coiled-coil homology domain-containing protein n=1 Tax=Endozoicomonas euniceicola TaxID=1234143 RepID=A0ABY6GQM2_9GAMM|nr:hypothetical protein [Endozoicomonas euniceicola]UYM15059.1 hypothetical protein NX720_19630 [Endozoicomonas euniceicola]